MLRFWILLKSHTVSDEYIFGNNFEDKPADIARKELRFLNYAPLNKDFGHFEVKHGD